MGEINSAIYIFLWFWTKISCLYYRSSVKSLWICIFFFLCSRLGCICPRLPNSQDNYSVHIVERTWGKCNETGLQAYACIFCCRCTPDYSQRHTVSGLFFSFSDAHLKTNGMMTVPVRRWGTHFYTELGCCCFSSYQRLCFVCLFFIHTATEAEQTWTMCKTSQEEVLLVASAKDFLL